jgi:site-specific recombinase
MRAATVLLLSPCLCLLLLLTTWGSAQSSLADLKAEHDPARRSEKALQVAESAFDSAREFYEKGEIQKGDAQLEVMTNALNECVASLDLVHKAKFYKKAEMRVATLMRRMVSLVDDIEVQKRGWAEYTQKRLEGIHDKLLEGVMRK